MNIFFKYLLKFGFLGTVTFLGLFVYFYKNSGKFRKSMIAAFAASTFFFAGLPTAHSAGEANGFTPQPQSQRNTKPGRSIFGSNQNNNDSGPGKPNNDDNDDSGIPKYPKTESVKETEELVESMDDDLRRLSEVIDSESEGDSAASDSIADQCKDANQKFKVRVEMSPTLSKVSKKVRKDKETSKSLDKMEGQLENGEFLAGRGAEKLPGTKTIYYMRAGNRGRLFFRYSQKEKGVIEKLAESNKSTEQEVIDNLKRNYE